ncbi:hypothetical protein C8R48DRAFT_671658 [Suillus tomentosus]|nr:hypothetical protein C8R48DRAFT_671658 [Suillus tomentosus]
MSAPFMIIGALEKLMNAPFMIMALETHQIPAPGTNVPCQWLQTHQIPASGALEKLMSAPFMIIALETHQIPAPGTNVLRSWLQPCGGRNTEGKPHFKHIAEGANLFYSHGGTGTSTIERTVQIVQRSSHSPPATASESAIAASEMHGHQMRSSYKAMSPAPVPESSESLDVEAGLVTNYACPFLPEPSPSQASFAQARQRRKIAELEEKIETLESGRAVKERQTNYYLAQGRGLRRIVALFDGIEDLVSENDRRYDADADEDAEAATVDQDRLHVGYHVLTRTFTWFVKSVSDMEHDDYTRMLKFLRQGADGARGDDTSKLKTLISDWVNRKLKPDPQVDSEDKHCRGFVNDACGMLLCPAELDWNNPAIRAGIRDRSEGHIVMELSFPTFLYEKYSANSDDLEDGLFKGKILLQGYKAVFTSPSSAKDTEGDGDGTDIVENNRRAKKALTGVKVKKHVVLLGCDWQ